MPTYLAVNNYDGAATELVISPFFCYRIRKLGFFPRWDTVAESECYI